MGDADREALYQSRKAVYAKAHGHWQQILRAGGLSDDYLRLRKAGPCPLCGGRDRYVFDDRKGDGDFHCRGCVGGGKGVTLLMQLHQWSWSVTVDWVLAYLADPQNAALLRALDERQVAARTSMAEGQRAHRMKAITMAWSSSRPVEEGDPVHRYLSRRAPGLTRVPDAIRFHPALEYWWRDPDSSEWVHLGLFPAMVAKVVDSTGKLCNVHRTYLDGRGGKAAPVTPHGEILQDIRKQMPGLGGEGLHIPLVAGPTPRYGLAEGIETALCAALRTGIPTDSVISTSGMRTAHVPDWVQSLTLFEDNDLPDQRGRRAGQDAVNALRKRADIVERIAERTLRLGVRTAAKPGADMADLSAL